MSETHIPVEVLSTEEREDGIYATVQMPDSDLDQTIIHGDSAMSVEIEYPIQSDSDLVERSPMSRDEMNALLEAEGLDIRVRDEPTTEEELTAARQAAVYAGASRDPRIASIFSSRPKQQTVTNPNKDRSLSGKARRKARKDR